VLVADPVTRNLNILVQPDVAQLELEPYIFWRSRLSIMQVLFRYLGTPSLNLKPPDPKRSLLTPVVIVMRA
jgi:hypothetical protein